MSSNNLSLSESTALFQEKIMKLDKKLNQLALENNELHKRNGLKINRVMKLVTRKNKKNTSSDSSYLVIVIIVSIIALIVIGFLVYKHFKGKDLSDAVLNEETIKAVTDSI